MDTVELKGSLIFVVDDVLSTVASICMFLEFHEFRVYRCISHGDAWTKIRQESEIHIPLNTAICIKVLEPESIIQ